MGTPFVGRASERRALAGALEAVHRGQPRIALVEGPPGIGKSSLLQVLVGQVEDAHVLDASGTELEVAVSWGVVDQLVRASGLDEAGLPAPLSELGPDAPTVGAGLVELFGTAFAGEPIVLVLDDAHWADLPSMQALTFALRRLRHDPLLALIGVRSEERARLPEGLLALASGPRGIHLTLPGLHVGELADLARGWEVNLSSAAAERMWAHTGGNPLHATALLDELDPAQLEQADEIPLPAPRSYGQLVLSRLAQCPLSTERLVAAAAVAGPSCPLALAAQIGGVEDPLRALDPAAATGLITARRDGAHLMISFVHALIRAAIYHDLSPHRLASLHQRAAQLVDDPRAALRHRARAAHDPSVFAADAERFARQEVTRGDWGSAADAFAHAAQLSADPARRETSLLHAIEAALHAGDGRAVMALVEQLDPALDSAHRRYVLGRVTMFSATTAQAAHLTTTSWQLCEPDAQPELAARIANQAALIAMNEGRATDAISWARRTLELSAAPPPDARLTLVLALHDEGCADELEEALSPLTDPMTTVGPDAADLLLGRGIVRLWRGAYDGAMADLELVHRVCARRGPFHTAYVALFYLADAQYRSGDWDGATASAQIAVSAMADAEQPWFTAFVHAAAAFPLSARGEWSEAEAHVRAAQAGAERRGDMAVRVWAATAAARLAHARNDAGGMLDALQPIRHYLGAGGARDQGMQPWALLLVEALTQTGRCGEARELLDELSADEDRAGVLTDVGRVLGLLHAATGDRAAAEEAFATGLHHASRVDLPFGRAQLALSHGAVQRRAGQRRAAGKRLLEARKILVELGAVPYLERCDRELAACGLEPRRKTGHVQPLLTPQELTVAHLVTQGATNREAAAELVLSVKAVEYHLSNIYRKLGIRSRTELAARMRTVTG
jgi:DNA-binding CsgD family transcriptional regulator